jgi:hypothetical protein
MSSIYIWSKNVSHSAYTEKSEATMAEIGQKENWKLERKGKLGKFESLQI